MPLEPAATRLHPQLGFLEVIQLFSLAHPLHPPHRRFANGSLERYAQGDENEEILQQLLEDVRGIARYGGGV